MLAIQRNNRCKIFRRSMFDSHQRNQQSTRGGTHQSHLRFVDSQFIRVRFHPLDRSLDVIRCSREPRLTDLDLLDGITAERLRDRRDLVANLDTQTRSLINRDLNNYPREERLAFDILLSPELRDAFDITKESSQTRER